MQSTYILLNPIGLSPYTLKTSMKKSIIPCLGFCTAVLICILCCCAAKPEDVQAAQGYKHSKNSAEVPVFQSDSKLGKVFPKIKTVQHCELLPDNAVPWGGVVSHHALSGKLIDEFFSRLSKKRAINTFILLSPDHFRASQDFVSVTNGSWNTPFGLVESDCALTEKLAADFGVAYNHRPFYDEHGVATLMPFIKKYFPNAKVAAIVYEVFDHYSGVTVKKYAECIKKNFQPESENFLLISSDFTHGADLQTTLAQEARSARFFSAPLSVSWQNVTCDNMPAIYTFSRIATARTNVTTLYKTNCLFLAPSDANPNDITSYFFSYFWEKAK